MLRKRVIPCLLLRSGGLVKTVRFRNPRYVGDPINAVRIFNEKLVDELILLDIEASKQARKPDLRLLEKIVSEAFMPVCYGGGVTSEADARAILACGVEKIAVNAAAIRQPQLIRRLADQLGSQSVVAAMDVKRSFGRRRVVDHTRRSRVADRPEVYARALERLGAGEILVNSVDRDGTMRGYDLPLVEAVAASVRVPVIACGGAGDLGHLAAALALPGVSAAAAGSLFVYRGVHRAVLINYPREDELERLLASATSRLGADNGPSAAAGGGAPRR